MIEVYAAIDILGGQCVRLKRGDFANPIVYGDPVEMAERWQSAGCDWLHVVDLDGALCGRSVNVSKVAAIIATTSRPVQLGGGLRDRDAVEAALGAGCERVVLGSAAVIDPASATEMARAWRGRVALALDIKRGEIAVEGWTKGSGITVDEAIGMLAEAPFASVVVTDIARDGLMRGVALETVEEVLEVTPWPVIVSGGISSREDAEAIADLSHRHRRGHKLRGVIVGRALYEGAVTIAEIKAAWEG